MIGFAAEKLMALKVGARTGASYDDKSTFRVAQRNGYRNRDWETRAAVELRIPSCGRAVTSPAASAASYGREGFDGRHPGDQYPGHLDASHP
jgi:hypothetical protein